MTERRQHRRPPGPLLSLLIEGTPLLWTALVCGALYYGVGVRPPPPRSESPQDVTRCVLVSPAGAADIRAWERNLYDWAALRDPTLLVLPNERFGFSRERFTKLEIPCAATPPYRFTMAPVGQSPAPPLSLAAAPLSLAERVASVREPIRPPPVEPFVVIPLERGVFWRTLDGAVPAGLPAFDEAQVRAAMAGEKPPERPTTLRLIRGDRPASTRVQVVSGCGNEALDALAEKVLRRAAVEAQLPPRQGGPTATAETGFLPPAGGEVELQVEWNLAPAAQAASPGS